MITRMAVDSKTYVPFSQRAGLAPIPPQLKLGQVSAQLRTQIYYYISLEIDRESRSRYNGSVLRDQWIRVAQDLLVLFFGQDIERFTYSSTENKRRLKTFIEGADFGSLFDFIEFLARHGGCSEELKHDLAQAFVSARAAYRIYDNQYIAAIGTQEQAAAFERAIDDAATNGATGARTHLVHAGVALRSSDWAGCVRESIHAVEAVAVRLATDTDTLGAALKVLERRGHLHGALKSAFEKLYGYTSDQEGVRHALVFSDEAKVDEADALFMLGACASFVSYLLARSKQGA